MIRNWKKILVITFAISLMAIALTACGEKKDTKKESNEKIKIVTTNFPPYDFVRAIGKDKVDLKMLVKPGAESHSYEPSPQDIKDIQNADLFIYTGGENDEWVNKIMKSMDKKKPKTIKMVDCVKVLDEETVEGMEPEEEHDHDADAKKDEHHDSSATEKHDEDKDKHDEDKHEDSDKHDEDKDDHDHDIDEHVWTSPVNAIKICDKICDEMVKKDSKNEKFYKDNCKEYTKKLKELDKKFENIVKNAKRDTIIVGDRFPLRYFVERYHLKYYAAFLGCSDQTEANAKTISFLIDKTKELKAPVVFSIELSNGKIANTICEATGAKRLTFNTCHNVTADQLKEGKTYLDLMSANLDVLKKALN